MPNRGEAIHVRADLREDHLQLLDLPEVEADQEGVVFTEVTIESLSQFLAFALRLSSRSRWTPSVRTLRRALRGRSPGPQKDLTAPRTSRPHVPARPSLRLFRPMGSRHYGVGCLLELGVARSRIGGFLF